MQLGYVTNPPLREDLDPKSHGMSNCRAHEYLYSAVRTKIDDLAAPSVWISETNTESVRALPVFSVVDGIQRKARHTAHTASHRQNLRLLNQLKNEL